MPVVQLRYKPGRDLKGIAASLAKALPKIVAPQMTVVGRSDGEGLVLEKDIIVEVTEGSPFDVNSKDLQITILVHEWPERRENEEERKDAVIAGVRKLIADNNRDVSGFVWVLHIPTAFGQI